MTQSFFSSCLKDPTRILFLIPTLFTAGIVVFMVGFILAVAWPVLSHDIIGFIFGTVWNYDTQEYGVFYWIVGTIITTLLTLCFACPLSIFTAIYLAEWSPKRMGKIFRLLIELLVGIPSVVYGIFGIFILGPLFGLYVIPAISNTFGFLPIFRNYTSADGTGIFLASVILTIMVLPTITVLSLEAMRSVPNEYREASLALGATKWETSKKVVIPAAKAGILTAVILGMMRAMGETMAIVMLIGNTAQFPRSIFDSAGILTAKILGDAGYYVTMDEPRSALFAVAAILFVMEFSFVAIARGIFYKSRKKLK